VRATARVPTPDTADARRAGGRSGRPWLCGQSNHSAEHRDEHRKASSTACPLKLIWLPQCLSQPTKTVAHHPPQQRGALHSAHRSSCNGKTCRVGPNHRQRMLVAESSPHHLLYRVLWLQGKRRQRVALVVIVPLVPALIAAVKRDALVLVADARGGKLTACAAVAASSHQARVRLRARLSLPIQLISSLPASGTSDYGCRRDACETPSVCSRAPSGATVAGDRLQSGVAVERGQDRHQCDRHTVGPLAPDHRLLLLSSTVRRTWPDDLSLATGRERERERKKTRRGNHREEERVRPTWAAFPSASASSALVVGRQVWLMRQIEAATSASFCFLRAEEGGCTPMRRGRIRRQALAGCAPESVGRLRCGSLGGLPCANQPQCWAHRMHARRRKAEQERDGSEGMEANRTPLSATRTGARRSLCPQLLAVFVAQRELPACPCNHAWIVDAPRARQTNEPTERQHRCGR
jgi:hypothetical protein